MTDWLYKDGQLDKIKQAWAPGGGVHTMMGDLVSTVGRPAEKAQVVSLMGQLADAAWNGVPAIGAPGLKKGAEKQWEEVYKPLFKAATFQPTGLSQHELEMLFMPGTGTLPGMPGGPALTGMMIGPQGMKRFYHATHRSFPKFSKAAAKRARKAGLSEGDATFLTDSTDVADTYLGGGFVKSASPSVKAHGAVDLGGGVSRYYSKGAQIRPVDIPEGTLNKFEVWDMGGGGYNQSFISRALKEAKANGAPGVIFENMRDPGIMGTGRGKPSNIVAIIDNKVLK
jgi:hypothetical protein